MKISEMTQSVTPSNDDVFPVLEGGRSNRKITFGTYADWCVDGHEYSALGNKTISGAIDDSEQTASSLQNAFDSIKAGVLDGGSLEDEASGTIVAISDNVDDTATKAVLTIEPHQEGSGDPSPDNIRPISGYTAVNIYHSGADTNNPTIYPITFPSEAGTVYGGTLDMQTGVLTVDRALYALSDITSWKLVGINSHGIASFDTGKPVISDMDITRKSEILCNVLPFQNVPSYGNVQTAGFFVSDARRIYMRIPSTVVSTVEAYTQWLSDNNVVFAYPISTPITYTLTPAQIELLTGSNTIWMDADGQITIGYKKDVKAYIDSKFAELQALVLENNG